MPTFQPSAYSTYGEADATAPSEGTDVSSYEQYVPLLREFVFGDDPRVEVSILQAKIAIAEEKVAKAQWPLKSYWKGQLSKLRAQLSAVQLQATEQQEAVKSEMVTRQGVAFLSVVGGLGLAAAVGAYVWVSVKRSQLLEAERQAVG